MLTIFLYQPILGAQRPNNEVGEEQVRRGGLTQLQRRADQPAGHTHREGCQDHPGKL